MEFLHWRLFVHLVADVAWVSAKRLEPIKHQTECSIAPEICIEVLSAANTDAETEEKRKLYFEKGAEEVWICAKTAVWVFARVLLS